MTPAESQLLENMAEDIRDIRVGVGAVQAALSEHRVEIEGRMSKVEAKASAWGIVSGALSALGARFFLGGGGGN